MAIADKEIPLFHIAVGSSVAIQLDYVDLFPNGTVLAVARTEATGADEPGKEVVVVEGAFAVGPLVVMNVEGCRVGESLITVWVTGGVYTDALQCRVAVH
jgi:hypothetical protein